MRLSQAINKWMGTDTPPKPTKHMLSQKAAANRKAKNRKHNRVAGKSRKK